jgi:hypothetical protein
MTPKTLFHSTLGQIPAGYKLVKSIAGEGRMVNVYKGPTDTIVAFGPTVGDLYVKPGEGLISYLKDGIDWFRNFDTSKIKVQLGGQVYAVHRGFFLEYLALKPMIAEHMGASTTFTGYSQGGTHAVFATLDTPYSKAITFAAPKCLDLWGAIKADNVADITRYQVNGDPVTSLPWGFEAVGKPVRMGKKGLWRVKHHEPSEYLNALETK